MLLLKCFPANPPSILSQLTIMLFLIHKYKQRQLREPLNLPGFYDKLHWRNTCHMPNVDMDLQYH